MTDANGRPIVAELGRPETAEETWARKDAARTARRQHQTAFNLVIALIASLGIVLFLGVVRLQEPPPYPSLADAGWLAMYPCLLVGLVGLARLRTLRLSTTLLLDGAVGALAATAVAVALLYPAVLMLSAPGTPAGTVVVNLAYPVLDLAIFVVVVGLLMLLEWQAPPAVWALTAGIAGFAVAGPHTSVRRCHCTSAP